MHNPRLATLLLATLFIPFVTTAQETPQKVSIDKLMSPQKRQETGVSSLTPAQRAALDRWLNAYTLRVIEMARTVFKESDAGGRAVPEYHSTGLGHWIKENGDGKIITLEDGSMWQISDFDQVDTALWLPVTDITVLRDPKGVGDFRYTLVDTEDGEKASAKYLGSQ